MTAAAAAWARKTSAARGCGAWRRRLPTAAATAASVGGGSGPRAAACLSRTPKAARREGRLPTGAGSSRAVRQCWVGSRGGGGGRGGGAAPGRHQRRRRLPRPVGQGPGQAPRWCDHPYHKLAARFTCSMPNEIPTGLQRFGKRKVGVSRLIARRRGHPTQSVHNAAAICIRGVVVPTPTAPTSSSIAVLTKPIPVPLGCGGHLRTYTPSIHRFRFGVHPPCLATMGRSLPRLVTWLLAVAVVLLVVSAFVSRTYCFLFLIDSCVSFSVARMRGLRATSLAAAAGCAVWAATRHVVVGMAPRSGARCWFCVNGRSGGLTC